MEYEIEISMFVKNPNYEKELEKYNERIRYTNDYNNPTPMPTEKVKCLFTRIDEQQFEAIRKAALEVF